jgi:hypothetical protein
VTAVIFVEGTQVGAVALGEGALGVEGGRSFRLQRMVGCWPWRVTKIGEGPPSGFSEAFERALEGVLDVPSSQGGIWVVVAWSGIVDCAFWLVRPVLGLRHVGLVVVEKAAHGRAFEVTPYFTQIILFFVAYLLRDRSLLALWLISCLPGAK